MKTAYVAALMSRAQPLIEMRRRSEMSQTNVAHACGVSLKTVQRFETLRSENAYLCFAYAQMFEKKHSPHSDK